MRSVSISSLLMTIVLLFGAPACSTSSECVTAECTAQTCTDAGGPADVAAGIDLTSIDSMADRERQPDTPADLPETTDLMADTEHLTDTPADLPDTPADLPETVDLAADNQDTEVGETACPEDLVCDDSNPCTLDLCSPEFGCVYQPAEGDCDDGNLCTLDDACSGGWCTGTTVDCSNLDSAGCAGICEPLGGTCTPVPTGDGLEVCDGLDNDCDGHVDEDLAGYTLNLDVACIAVLDVGVCASEHLDTFCGQHPESGDFLMECDLSNVPDYTEVEDLDPGYCDGLDNDCDGLTDEEIFVFDPAQHQQYDTGCLQLGVCAAGTVATCTSPDNPISGEGNWECHYADVEFFVGAVAMQGMTFVEVACDGLDNDCDGLVDEGLGLDLEWAGDLNPKLLSGCPQEGVCTDKMLWGCQETAWFCDPSNAEPDYETHETLCDSLDNDCDGTTDVELHDVGPAGAGCKLQGVCEAGVTADCVEGDYLCYYDEVAGYQGAAESKCDGLDNDCDGQADEALVWSPGAGCGDIWGTGVCDPELIDPLCLGLEGWDCPVPHTVVLYYEAEETSCDQLDNDCDGQVDEAVCQAGEPCSGPVNCVSSSCLHLPELQGGGLVCSLSNSYCPFYPVGSEDVDYALQGSSVCIDESTRASCGAGAWFEMASCAGETALCHDGECVSCVPGTRKCDGKTIVKCGNDGAGFEPDGLCGATFVCQGSGVCAPDVELKLNGSPVAYDAHELRPRIATRHQGGFALAFESTLMAAGEQGDVVLRCFSATATGDGPGKLANELVQGNQTLPALADLPTNDGGFFVVWQDSNSPEDGDGAGIVGRLFDAQCNATSASLQLNTGHAGNQTEPAVAAIGNGNALVAWRDEGSDPTLVRARLVKDGEATGLDFTLSSWLGSPQSRPALAPVDATWFAAVWQQDEGQESDVFFRLLGGEGSAMCEPDTANNLTAGDQLAPAVAGFAGPLGGEFAVTWLSADGDSEAIFLRTVDNGCTAQGDDLTVSAGPATDLSHPAMTILEDNTMVIVWSAAGLAGDDDGHGIASRLFQPDGAALNPLEFTVNFTGDGEQLHPQATDLGNGVYVVVWSSIAPSTGAVNILARVLNGP